MHQLKKDRGTILYATLISQSSRSSKTEYALPVFNLEYSGLTKLGFLKAGELIPFSAVVTDFDGPLIEVKLSISYPDGSGKKSNPLKMDEFKLISWADNDLAAIAAEDPPETHAFIAISNNGIVTKFCSKSASEPC
jgi:hypothetical protein